MFKSLIELVYGKPVRIRVEFESREYSLGETINLIIKMEPKQELTLNNGHIELICKQTYSLTHVRQVSIGRSGGMIRSSLVNPPSKITHPKREIHKYVDEFKHSSLDFVQETTIHPDGNNNFEIDLPISQTLPPHINGKLKWYLLVSCEFKQIKALAVAKNVSVRLPE